MPCEQIRCPGGFEIVAGFEDRGCQAMCPRGQQRDEFGFCFDDKDCNVTSSSIEDAFPEIDAADADTLAALINEYGNSTKLGNFIYANKNGNGNEASGDGYKFRGRGLFQLTGRENYQKFTTFYNERFNTDLNFETNPATVASNTKISVISALWYYRKRVLKKVNINSNTSIEVVTKKSIQNWLN